MTETAHLKKAKKALKEIIAICYESDCNELQQEIASLERSVKNDLDSLDGISDIIRQIEENLVIFSDDIDTEDYLKIEELIIEITEIE